MYRRLAIILLAASAVSLADEIRMIRALSGPSGRVDGSKFIFDETRSRFVFPQDKSLVVYFEWDAPAGPHTMTAYWKQPDGRTASISPDLKIQTSNRELRSYWTFLLNEGMASGIWSVEIRVDGQPAGSQSFEIFAPEIPKAVSAPSPASPQPPSLDQIFRTVSQSMVWVRKIGESGHRTDTSSGFIYGKNRVVTAFQSVDATGELQIEFPDGRKVETSDLLAWSRPGDWAVVAADTGSSPVLAPGDTKSIVVGERLIAFNVEGAARAIGGVDITGRRTVPVFGERVQISPALDAAAAGGPLLDLWGHVVGIVGGSTAPGGRVNHRFTNVGLSLLNGASTPNAAVPISVLPARIPNRPSTLLDLIASGVLTAPLDEMPEFLYGSTALETPKRADATPPEVNEFSRSDAQVWVHSNWAQKGKLTKGMVSAKVYDEMNRVRIVVPARKVTLERLPVRLIFGFPPSQLSAGISRIDLMWDDKPVWRTFIRITE